jgi:hypothetical protein
MIGRERHCASTRLVDRHFFGRIAPADERRLRSHLKECRDCREQYERWLWVSQIDLTIPARSYRLGVGLGLHAPSLVGRLPQFALIAVTTLGCVAAVLAGSRFLRRYTTGLPTSHEGPSMSAEFAVYSIGRDDAPAALLRPDSEIAPDEALGFAYAKASGAKRLMIFGIGEQGRVFWYKPGRADATANSAGLPISHGELLHELSDARTRTLDEGTVRLFALFTSRDDLRASEVEAAAAGARPALALRLPGCELRSMPLHVRRRSQ